MALFQVLSKKYPIVDNANAALRDGLVYLYAPGSSSEFVSTYEDSALSAEHANPVKISGFGKVQIWITGDADLVIKDSDGNTVVQELNINPDPAFSGESGGLVPNGSFEVDTDSNGIPDGWSLTSYTGATNAIDDTEQTDGNNSFRFTSASNGGGVLITDDFFPVNDVDVLTLQFDIRSTIAACRNIVNVKWFDVDKASLSTSAIYDDSTTNPTSYTNQVLTATPPSGARFAKVELIGFDPSVSATGSTYFDRLVVYYSIVQGNLQLTSNKIVSANTDGNIELDPNGTGKILLDTDGDAVIEIGSLTDAHIVVDPAANELKFANGTPTPTLVLEEGSNEKASIAFNASGQIEIKAEDSGSSQDTVFLGDPDGESALYYQNEKRLRTTSDGANIRTDSAAAIGSAQSGHLGMINGDNDLIFAVDFSVNGMQIKSLNHGDDFILSLEDSSGIEKIFITANVAGALDFYHPADGALSAQTVFPNAGGFKVVNELTGDSVQKRVLTTIDGGLGAVRRISLAIDSETDPLVNTVAEIDGVNVGVYEVDFILVFTQAVTTTQGIKLRVAHGGTATLSYQTVISETPGSPALVDLQSYGGAAALNDDISFIPSNNETHIISGKGILDVTAAGSTTDTLSLFAAQQVSSANATTITSAIVKAHRLIDREGNNL